MKNLLNNNNEREEIAKKVEKQYGWLKKDLDHGNDEKLKDKL